MKRKTSEAVQSKSPDRSAARLEPKSTAGEPAARACPICGKPATVEMRPFCSKRCADIDLHHWLGGSYAIPVVEENGADGDGTEDET